MALNAPWFLILLYLLPLAALAYFTVALLRKRGSVAATMAFSGPVLMGSIVAALLLGAGLALLGAAYLHDVWYC